jgi:hypothetical protein
MMKIKLPAAPSFLLAAARAVRFMRRKLEVEEYRIGIRSLAAGFRQDFALSRSLKEKDKKFLFQRG